MLLLNQGYITDGSGIDHREYNKKKSRPSGQECLSGGFFAYKKGEKEDGNVVIGTGIKKKYISGQRNCDWKVGRWDKGSNRIFYYGEK